MTCLSCLHPLFYQNLPTPEPAEAPSSTDSFWPREVHGPLPAPLPAWLLPGSVLYQQHVVLGVMELLEVRGLVLSPRHVPRETVGKEGLLFLLGPPSPPDLPLLKALAEKELSMASLTLLQKEFMMVYSFRTLSFKVSTRATLQHWGDATKSRSLASTQ